MKDVRRSEEPMDRLTELANQVIKPLDDHPDVKGILFLSDEHKGGIVLHGYDDDTAGIAALLYHLQALFAAHGKRLDIMTEDGFILGEG